MSTAWRRSSPESDIDAGLWVPHYERTRVFKGCRKWNRVCESPIVPCVLMGRITAILPKDSPSLCRGFIA
jgi:hypothetical protein